LRGAPRPTLTDVLENAERCFSAVSLFVGASLGPSFGIVVSGGGLGAWIVSRSSTTDTEARHEYSLTGMAGGLGAVFSAPLFAPVLASELSQTPKTNLVAAFIPEFIAATIGYVISFGVTGKVMLDAFDIPGYQYETVHLLYGLLLGVLTVLTLLAHSMIGNTVRRPMEFYDVWMALGQPTSNLETRRLAVATSLLLISGFKFLAARSRMGIESTPYGERA
jgi:H+/Cl- antiporter ClcA